VTIAMALDRRMAWSDVPGYVVARLVGALAAALAAQVLFGGDAAASVITRPGGGFSEVAALGLEVLLAAGFVLVILAATVKSPGLAGIVIPLALVAIHFPAVPFTGASVNPARSIGPAVVAGDLGSLWIYVVAPVLGGVIAWAVWRSLVMPADEDG
jgi:aquaporin Z